ncbi:hypothetical protein P9112_007533 [Eukaryota sp. TZLM1-RC]
MFTSRFLTVCLTLAFCLALGYAEVARLWPTPQHHSFGTKNVLLDNDFQFETSTQLSLLEDAFKRYREYILTSSLHAPEGTSAMSLVSVVSVQIDSRNLDLNMGTDESYEISITEMSISISARTVYGALRALETFSQLVEESSDGHLYIRQCPITIKDFPRYQWRGLLIDTSRHFLPVGTIKRMVDSLSFNKMNVLHWHIVDAQSFPYKSLSYPSFAERGAFRPDLVYDSATIKSIVDYAQQRGVRVVMELDVPGHAYWGDAAPHIRAQCPGGYSKNVNNYPLDPSKGETFDVISDLIGELSDLTIDDYFHLGGDEPVFSCWTKNTEIKQWMDSRGFKSGNDVYSYFFNKTLPFVYKKSKKPIVWHEAALLDSNLPKDTLVQVWSGESNVEKVINMNFDIIYSVGYYLDKSKPAGKVRYAFMQTMADFFEREPTRGLSELQASRIKGLSAAMWSEGVDANSIEERVWPRASGTADRAWIKLPDNVDMAYENRRAERQRCRMNGRGIRASPLVPWERGLRQVKGDLGNFCRFSVAPFN